jgi:hypothetical protein
MARFPLAMIYFALLLFSGRLGMAFRKLLMIGFLLEGF